MVVNTFGWSRLAVFYTSDDIDSSDTFFEFNERANENNFTILGSMNFNKATTDFSSSILSALQSDPRVIVLFMKPERAAPFLEQAFTLGLLREGVTVVGGTYTSNSTLFSFFSRTAPVKYIMKGYIGLTPAMY